MLTRILYYSALNFTLDKAAIRGPIVSILESSRRNNPSRGLSGVLVFTNSHFLQVLEGPRDSLSETFYRISRDLRHRDVRIVEMKPIAGRVFDRWAMQLFDGRGDSQRAVLQSLRVPLPLDPDTLTPEQMLQVLVTLHAGGAAADPPAAAAAAHA